MANVMYDEMGNVIGVIEDETPQQPAQIRVPNVQPISNAGTTQAGMAGNSAAGRFRPNIRKNPLGEYSSYTYQLSLYMITPDAYDDFINNNRTRIETISNAGTGKGAYLIAQSGGINNDVTPRAPGFKYDHYIDNLVLGQAISPQSTGTSSKTFDVSFNIIEPYGFSFLTNLKIANDRFRQYSSQQNRVVLEPVSQLYILGIKFLGYDDSGNIIQETQGMFERYFDIKLNEFKFRVDGKMVVYDIKAASLPIQEGMGIKRGQINKGASVKGSTVKDALLGNDPANGIYGLITKLNKDEEENTKLVEKNRYFVEFYGLGSDEIANATIVSKADTDKARTPMSNAKTTNDINPTLELKAVPNLTAKEISFKNDTPVLQAIQQIISQSSYLTDAFKEIYLNEREPSSENGPDEIKPDTKKRIKWYNLSTRVTNPRRDPARNDWVYDITYVIEPYETPVILSSLTNDPANYYGPIKRYDYWYTGQNTEIIRYEQTMSAAYFNIMKQPLGSAELVPGMPSIVVDKRQPVQRLGWIDNGSEAQNQYITQLLDPEAYAEAKIEILGDPDWLMQPSPAKLNDPYSPFYGIDGYTINPNAGQVFIEIDFKEAVDYETDEGLLKINLNILFFDYPENVKNLIKGISYRVNNVYSYFRSGKFTQELKLVHNIFQGYRSKTTINQRDEYESETKKFNRQGTGSATTPSGGNTSNTGLKPVPQSNTSTTVSTNTNTDTSNASTQQTTTETGREVADDDAYLYQSYVAGA